MKSWFKKLSKKLSKKKKISGPTNTRYIAGYNTDMEKYFDPNALSLYKASNASKKIGSLLKKKHDDDDYKLLFGTKHRKKSKKSKKSKKHRR
jgi:hypothetical protein